MIEFSASEIADATKAQLRGDDLDAHPSRVVIDSREAGVGDLFFGLSGREAEGGGFAVDALERGAWGVVVDEAHSEAAGAAAGSGQAVFIVEDPIAALGGLAGAWRDRLGAVVIGVTGSTGKTTTKDIIAALIGKTRTVVATGSNFNTEIGLPLTILGASTGTEVLVLEMAMRGPGQIAELTRIARPDVGAIVNIGPVHLAQLKSIENIAAAKAELIAGLTPGSVAVVPSGDSLIAPFLREDLHTITFGDGGDVRLLGKDSGILLISTPEGEIEIVPSFSEDYLIRNLLVAVACASAIGAPAAGVLEAQFSALRGERLEVLSGVILINDCYNANPVSMRAALDNLALCSGRRIAVLGEMAELGSESERFHREIGEYAVASGVDLIVAVGERARAYAGDFTGAIARVASPEEAAQAVSTEARPGDTVLIKGSRSVGLERVAEELSNFGRAAGSFAGGTRPRDGST